MDRLNLGDIGRRTHLRPKANLPLDKYGMEDVDDFFRETTLNFGDDQDTSQTEMYPRSSRYSPIKAKSTKLHQVPRRSLLGLSKLSMIPLGTPARLAIEAENYSFTKSLRSKKSKISTRETIVSEGNSFEALSADDFVADEYDQGELRAGHEQELLPMDSSFENNTPQSNSILEEDEEEEEEDPNPELPGSPIRVDSTVLFSTSKDTSQSGSAIVDLGLPSPLVDRSFDGNLPVPSNAETTASAEFSDLPRESTQDESQGNLGGHENYNTETLSFGGDFFDNDDGLDPEQNRDTQVNSRKTENAEPQPVKRKRGRPRKADHLKAKGRVPKDSGGREQDLILNPDENKEIIEDMQQEDVDLQPVKRRRASTQGARKEVKIIPSLPSPSPDGLRRSTRKRIAPLAFWKNERVVYGKSAENLDVDPDSTLVRHVQRLPLLEIQEVLTYPEEEARPRRKIPRPLKSGLVGLNGRFRNFNDLYVVPEADEKGAEWYQDRVLEVEVFESADTLTTTKVACAPRGVRFSKVSTATGDDNEVVTEKYRLGTIFSDPNEIMAAAYLDLPLNGVKRLQSSKGSLYFFNVVIGKVEVHLNKDRFIAYAGTTFKIPPENRYSIRNVGESLARLFVVQGDMLSIQGSKK